MQILVEVQSEIQIVSSCSLRKLAEIKDPLRPEIATFINLKSVEDII